MEKRHAKSSKPTMRMRSKTNVPDCTFLYPPKVQWKQLRHPPRRNGGGLGRVRHRSHAQGCPHEPVVRGVLDVRDFNEQQSGHAPYDDDRLEALIEVLSRYRLGLKDTEPIFWGALTNISCGNFPRTRDRAPVSSTRRRRSAG